MVWYSRAVNHQKIPINHPENNELLGYVVSAAGSWQAQTIFGYTMQITPDEASARQLVLENGLSYLKGVWQYFDSDEREWHPCVINEANPLQVRVTRTTEMGYLDPEIAKTVIIKKPDETNLIKG